MADFWFYWFLVGTDVFHEILPTAVVLVTSFTFDAGFATTMVL